MSLKVSKIKKDEETQLSNFKFREFGTTESSKERISHLELPYVFCETTKFQVPFVMLVCMASYMMAGYMHAHHVF
jgi:hypothetical protein